LSAVFLRALQNLGAIARIAVFENKGCPFIAFVIQLEEERLFDCYDAFETGFDAYFI